MTLNCPSTSGNANFATLPVVSVGHRFRPFRAPAKGTPRARHLFCV